MREYEKRPKKKLVLKKYQKILIGILVSIFLIATIILLVMFKDSIFSENVMVLVMVVVFILLVIGGFVVLWLCKK